MNELLTTRELTHGKYENTARIGTSLRGIIELEVNQRAIRGQDPLTVVQRDALDMITVKIARIIAGNSDELDHWRDIKGYADLALAELQPLPPNPTPGQLL